ncbi:hypothetical protein NL676_021655 [Syzygium grande]|nr:hypothetical protein NL676_021655 [Syzygium grande]
MLAVAPPQRRKVGMEKLWSSWDFIGVVAMGGRGGRRRMRKELPRKLSGDGATSLRMLRRPCPTLWQPLPLYLRDSSSLFICLIEHGSMGLDRSVSHSPQARPLFLHVQMGREKETLVDDGDREGDPHREATAAGSKRQLRSGDRGGATSGLGTAHEVGQ